MDCLEQYLQENLRAKYSIHRQKKQQQFFFPMEDFLGLLHYLLHTFAWQKKQPREEKNPLFI